MEDGLLAKVLDEDSVLVEDRRYVRMGLDGVSSFGISRDGCGLVIEEEVMTERKGTRGFILYR